MIVMCPGCSGIDIDIVKGEFKDEKIVYERVDIDG